MSIHPKSVLSATLTDSGFPNPTGFEDVSGFSPPLFVSSQTTRLLFSICLALLLSFSVRAQFGLTINSGARVTNHPEVELRFSATGLKEMMISNEPTFAGANWAPFQRTIRWVLDESRDGPKVVYARFKDMTGKETDPFVAEITLDRQPPYDLGVDIGAGTYTTTHKGVQIQIRAKDAWQMMVSNYPDFRSTRWAPFQPRFSWDLPTGDGEKMVYVKLKDEAGNETEVFTDKIILDATPPTGASVSIQAAELTQDSTSKVKYTNKKLQGVDLVLAVEGAEYFMVSNERSFRGAKWRFLREPVLEEWDLQAVQDGPYQVFVQFRDKAGNTSEIVSDQVILDTHPPVECRIRINEGEPLLISEKVNLYISAKGADLVRISEDSTFAGAAWQKLRPLFPWTFPDENGPKRIFAQFTDLAGNLSAVVMAKATLDKEAPQDMLIQINEGAKTTDQTFAFVVLRATDAESMMFGQRPDLSDGVWMRYSEKPLRVEFSPNPGLKTIYARFRDVSGNITPIMSESIMLTVKPVGAWLKLDGGADYCTDPQKQVKVELFARFADSVMLSNTPDFSNARWVPYRTQSDWKLEGEDGPKTIYALFKNFTGTLSDTIRAAIRLDITRPQNPRVLINRGAPSTLDRVVTVEVAVEGGSAMQVSTDPAFKDAVWKAYDFRPFTMELFPGGGPKTIYARFKDDAGNLSDVASARILLDVRPLEARVLIDGDASWCTDPAGNVTLFLHALQVKEMMVSNQSGFDGASWQPFRKQLPWQLDTSADGMKAVYVKYRSESLTESEVVKDEIILDRTPPTNPSIRLEKPKPEKLLHPHHVEVHPLATGAISMQISEHPDFLNERWMPYSEMPYLLMTSFGNGEKTIYARFRDPAGNTTAPVSGKVMIDWKAPSNGTVLINDGASHVPSRYVVLKFVVEEAAEVRLSNSPQIDQAAWMPLGDVLNWELAGTDGLKRVFFQFRDADQNTAMPGHASTYLDTELPTGGQVRIKEVPFCTHPERRITLQLSCKGATRMKVRQTDQPEDAVAWQPFKTELFYYLQGEDGQKEVEVVFADDAGNQHPPVRASTRLVTRGPGQPSVQIQNGDYLYNQQKVSLQLSADPSATEMIVSNTPAFVPPVRWEPFRPEMNWMLAPGDGLKTVYARFRNEAGVESVTVMDTIRIDTEPPITYFVRINNGAAETETAEVKVSNSAMGAIDMQLSNRADFLGAEWQPYQKETDWNLLPLDPATFGLFGEAVPHEERTVYMRFRDEAGNISLPISDAIMLYERERNKLVPK